MYIIGKSECTASQMAQYLINLNPNAKSWALEYAQIYLEEGESEGVRGDGAWIQSCKETGNFKFTGGTAVTFDQNNFCGLGVTRKGVKGHSFNSPRLGIRAQIQHLKGYATTTPLKNVCVDPRYKYINPKGKAPHFEELAGKWAIPGYDTKKASSLEDAMRKGIGYGFDIINGINQVKMINVQNKFESKGDGKMKINIHAGHNTDGKVACGAIGLIKESTEARIVKNKVISMLKSQGHTVYDCTVDNGISQNDVLKKIVSKCNEHTVDLDVSIHFNSGSNDKKGNGKTTGTEVFVYSSASKAKKYAQNIVTAISNLGFKNRGVKYSTSLYVLKNTKSPSLLIEVCFVDDVDDIKIYNADKVAQAIVKGITGTESIIPPTTSKPSPPVTSNTLYRVRKSWGDSSSQIGAYGSLENAKAACKSGYYVFDSKGNVVYPKNDSANNSQPSTVYNHSSFVRDIQKAIGAKVDGIVGSETLSKTITVSKTKNNKHTVVKPIQKYLNSIGYNCGTADGVAGSKFDSAVKAFQKANGCVVDGEITSKKSTWKKLLKLS